MCGEPITWLAGFAEYGTGIAILAALVVLTWLWTLFDDQRRIRRHRQRVADANWNKARDASHRAGYNKVEVRVPKVSRLHGRLILSTTVTHYRYFLNGREITEPVDYAKD